ncbi:MULTISPECIES: FeoA family protein [Arcobacteraceae]|uniref:Iron transporter n=1 Tax=Poseidonibacter parvus TaxID=1850254 RepID=A0A1P8KP65_9BACT|nr:MULTISPECIES: FeoA family protein [Arcobacteraceae]APW66347.1 iron transporter [Poseidonibacter parvus]
MTLDKLNIGESAIIKAVNCENALKNRFYSFGMVKGSKVYIEEVTLTKSTMEIRINTTKVAIRLSEAKKIEIENEQ